MKDARHNQVHTALLHLFEIMEQKEGIYWVNKTEQKLPLGISGVEIHQEGV